MNTHFRSLNKSKYVLITLISLLPVLFFPMNKARMADFTVSTPAELNQAIIEANGNPDANIITLSNNIILTGTLTTIDSEITIEGAEHSVNGANLYRIFDVSATGDLTLNHITIENGFIASGNGGGVFNDGILSINSSIFSGNIAENDGGAIRNLGILVIENSVFVNNSAGARGGAVYNTSAGNVSINNCTFSGNSAHYGGAILTYTRSEQNSISNSTLYNNSASSNGGGIRNNGTLVLNHNLISGNSAPVGAEFYHNTNSDATTLANDYNVFGHSGLTDEQAYFDFLPGINDFNATSNAAPSTGSNIPITDILDTNLTDNGGSTLTHALVNGSPAVDTYTNTLSTCPATDQRGFERPWPTGGYCDSGAFEYEYVTQYTLNYTAGTHGSLDGDTSQVVNYGGDGTPITANPETGYHFVNWSDGSTANPRTDTNVTANIAVTANFEIDTFTLDYSAGTHGSLSGETSQVVNYGGNGTPVTANPETGYHFVDWSDGSTANPRTDTNVTANIAVTANFALNGFTLTIVKEGMGNVEIAPEKSIYQSGEMVTLTAIPEDGWYFVGWKGDLLSTINPFIITMNVDKVITATFMRKSEVFLPIVIK